MIKMVRDAERGESTPLISQNAKMLNNLGSYRGEAKRGSLASLPVVPVGGHAGNAGFFTILELSLRVSVFLMILGTLIWLPDTVEAAGLGRFAQHAGLAACLTVFFVTNTVGGVINTASAGVSGCFMACLNIFILRGFIPDGVTPGMGFFSTASIVGWIDLSLFNLLVLGFNLRMGFRMTALALNVNFMMCFLNPDDQTIFSKNFKINPKGAAVSAFIGVCLGSLCAVLAVVVPYPLGWSTKLMKSAGKAASEDTCKLFIAAVKYFRGSGKNILIERQLAQASVLKVEIDGLGTNIDNAYVEALDMHVQGCIRALYEKHAASLGETFDILSALQMALASEDFGPSHDACMEAIGEEAHDLIDESCILLMRITESSEDGVIQSDEYDELRESEEAVEKALLILSKAFDDARRKFGKTISKELMNESFFVFAISAFARVVVSYAHLLRTNPPSGSPLGKELVNNFKGMVDIPLWYHWRIVSRYWLSLMGCFLFSVTLDNYVPACAITGVFLINQRVGPDVMAMIQGLLAVVVGIVTNALMYSFSCRFGNTSVLMVVAFFYWNATVLVGKGTSSIAGIGLLMAALSPFALFKFCEPDSPELQAAQAIGLWGGIRALLIAVVITVFMEIIHVPGLFTKMASDSMDKAFEAMKVAFKSVWAKGDRRVSWSQRKQEVDDALALVVSSLADAETYNTAAFMEPRLWKAPWKGQFLIEVSAQLKRIRLDVLVIQKALVGPEGDMGRLIQLFNQIPEGERMTTDLNSTLEDARELTGALLNHEHGKFSGLKLLDTIEGLDELDGFEQAVETQSKMISWPKETPDSMEGDELVRISIIFVMLDYLVKHTAAVVKTAVKRC